MCVASWEGYDGTDFVATGSKDHYVKVFEVSSTAGIVSPLLHLEVVLQVFSSQIYFN